MCIRDSSFGPAGSYEYLTGVMIFGIEPNLSSNKMVCDLDLAPVCLLYTSDAADERSSVDLGGRRIFKKKKEQIKKKKNR